MTDAQLVEMLVALHDERQYAKVADLTDAWLAARDTLPASAAIFRCAALQGVGRYDEAVTWGAIGCKAITEPNDGWIASRITFGDALARAGDFPMATAMYRAALKAQPFTDDAGSIVPLAHLRLALKTGSWKKGWADHERRIGTPKVPEFPKCRDWDGGPTDGPVVVLHEQGIGDDILLSRYLPWVVERSGHPVIVAAPTLLHRYLEALLPGQVVAQAPNVTFTDDNPADAKLRHGTCIVRGFTLPHLHGTRPHTIPAPIAPPIGRGTEPRIGVNWQGSATFSHDFDRSIPLDTFRLVWEQSPLGVPLTSLAYQQPVPDATPFPAWDAEGDILHAAQRIARCTAVVTVDTYTAHVAGSLNIPTLLLAKTTPDWRWTPWPDGHTTPWYHSVLVLRRDNASPDAVADQCRTANAILRDLLPKITHH